MHKNGYNVSQQQEEWQKQVCVCKDIQNKNKKILWFKAINSLYYFDEK